MPIVRGTYTDRGGRPASGSITLTPEQGAPVVIKVNSGVLARTDVPAGTYEVTASLRSNASVRPIALHPARFIVPPEAREVNLTGIPGLVHPATGPQLSIVETAPGVYEVTKS